jgi:hypothetical protein
LIKLFFVAHLFFLGKGVGDDGELPHDGDDGEFGWLPGVGQAGVELLEIWVESGGNQRWPIEGIAQSRSSATDVVFALSNARMPGCPDAWIMGANPARLAACLVSMTPSSGISIRSMAAISLPMPGMLVRKETRLASSASWAIRLAISVPMAAISTCIWGHYTKVIRLSGM